MSAARKKRQLSRHARGYTNAHVARRRQLEPLVATGQVGCCRCNELIEAGQAWHLDHRDDRRGYLGPSHATCNLRAAAEKTNGKRKRPPADLVTGLVRADPAKRHSQRQRRRRLNRDRLGAGWRRAFLRRLRRSSGRSVGGPQAVTSGSGRRTLGCFLRPLLARGIWFAALEASQMGEEFDMQRSGISRPLALLAAGGCLFLGVLSSVAGAAAPMFVTAPGSPLAADGPNWEGIADVDRDGRLDLAVANELTDSVSIRLGDGTGGFGAPTAVPVGDTPTSLALADFTCDGRLDMAVANPGSDNVTIHIGDGTGGFSAGSPIGLPDAPWYIEVGDVNLDKRLDLVVPHVGSIVGTSFVASHDV